MNTSCGVALYLVDTTSQLVCCFSATHLHCPQLKCCLCAVQPLGAVQSVENAIDARATAAAQLVEQTNNQPSCLSSVHAKDLEDHPGYLRQIKTLFEAALPGPGPQLLTQINQLKQHVFILLQKRFALCPDMRCAVQLSPAAGVCVGCGALCCPNCTSRCPKYGRAGHRMKAWCQPRCATQLDAAPAEGDTTAKEIGLTFYNPTTEGDVTGVAETASECCCKVLEDKSDTHTVALITMELLQSSDNNQNFMKVNGWLTAPGWQSCNCSEVLLDLLWQLRDEHAPAATIHRNVHRFNFRPIAPSVQARSEAKARSDKKARLDTFGATGTDTVTETRWELKAEEYLIDYERCFKEIARPQLIQQCNRIPGWRYDLRAIEEVLQRSFGRQLSRPIVLISCSMNPREKAALYAAMTPVERVVIREDMAILGKQEMVTLMSPEDNASMVLAMSKSSKKGFLNSLSVSSAAAFFAATPESKRPEFFAALSSAKQTAMMEAMTEAEREECTGQLSLSDKTRCYHCKVAARTTVGKQRQFWHCMADICSISCCNLCSEPQQLCPGCRGVGCDFALSSCQVASCRAIRAEQQTREADAQAATASLTKLVEMLDSQEDAVRASAFNALNNLPSDRLQKVKVKLESLFLCSTQEYKQKNRHLCTSLLKKLPGSRKLLSKVLKRAFDDIPEAFAKPLEIDSHGKHHVEKQALQLAEDQLQQEDCRVFEQLSELLVSELLSAPEQQRCRGAGESVWIACSDCKKWRRVAKLPSQLTKWKCSHNLKSGFNECIIPQELSDVDIDRELHLAKRQAADAAVPDGSGTTCADAVVRLWSVVSKLPSGTRVSAKSQSQLLDCVPKLGKLLRHPEIVLLPLHAVRNQQPKGSWTVHGAILMCLAQIYTLKGPLSQRATSGQQIQHRMLRILPLEILLQEIRFGLTADIAETAAECWQHLESNNRCAALSLCLTLCEDQSKIQIAKYLLRDVCQVLQGCLSLSLAKQTPQELERAVQLLFVFSQDKWAVGKLTELGLHHILCCADGKLRARLGSESKGGGWGATAKELAHRVKLDSKARVNTTQHPRPRINTTRHPRPHLLPKPPTAKRKLSATNTPKESNSKCDVCGLRCSYYACTCRVCGVVVHADCYCPSAEAGTVRGWQCERCREGLPGDTQCTLCGMASGAMKRVHSANNNLWAHVRCTAKARITHRTRLSLSCCCRWYRRACKHAMRSPSRCTAHVICQKNLIGRM